MWYGLAKRIIFTISLLLIVIILPEFSNRINKSSKLLKKSQLSNSDEKAYSSTVLSIKKVEKLNAMIEEQIFLFSTLRNDNKAVEQVLSKIEHNLSEVEVLAKHYNLDKVIDYPSICELREKIVLFRKNK